MCRRAIAKARSGFAIPPFWNASEQKEVDCARITQRKRVIARGYRSAIGRLRSRTADSQYLLFLSFVCFLRSSDSRKYTAAILNGTLRNIRIALKLHNKRIRAAHRQTVRQPCHLCSITVQLLISREHIDGSLNRIGIKCPKLYWLIAVHGDDGTDIMFVCVLNMT